MGQRFNPVPIARYDQSLLPVLNGNFTMLARLLASIPTESIGPTAPDNPYPGQTWIDTATYTLRVWNGSAWTKGPFANYTATVVQGVTLTQSGAYNRFRREGNMVSGMFSVPITSTGTNGAAVTIGVPVNAATGGIFQSCGGGWVFDNAIGNIPMELTLNTAGTGFQYIVTGGVYSPNPALNNGDSVNGHYQYEAA